MRRNMHIYPSDFQYESRIFKITQSLLDQNLVDDILLVGIGDGTLPEEEALGVSRRIKRIPLTDYPVIRHKKLRRVLHYLEWIGKASVYGYRQQITIVNCHSLFDLPVGIVLKILRKCLVIYDTHELETERNGLKKGLVKTVAKTLEKVAIRYVDHVFVVSDSIAAWYRHTYHLDCVTVVKNVPYGHVAENRETHKGFREQFAIPPDHLIFVYQGALFHGRGIPLLLSVFSRLQPHKHVVFMGYGILEDTIREYEQQYPHIHFCPAVPPDRVMEYTASADVGLSLIENTCLSYYYCLPNKLFEYIINGIPCIVSNFPDMRAVIEHYHCGWITEVNAQDIYNLIDGLTVPHIREIQDTTAAIRDQFGWHLEERHLLAAYTSLLSRS
ncbi:glycosyltransferase [candidate division KSB3 bacterium]|uniref:Glycosyltransferase n=1 Tax=candidate division KSB3 bacterium TaxID=2044937 RepID=A0A9D5JWC2_9BACT|nr:glycosyltransferase [candidate division KSB3 bacterium]MBD3324911.1 glycosyltransferase [candidate division KSB3 bacterium]